MKNYLLLTALGLSLGAKCIAAPFLAVGDSAELFINGNLGVRADDNIFLASAKDDDVVFDVAPGLELAFGKGGQIQGAFTLVDAFTSYADHSNLNTNLASTNVKASYDDGKLKMNAALGYTELNQNTADIRGLTRRDVFSTDLSGELQVSQLLSFGTGASFSHENYKRSGYADSDSLTIPFNLYYATTPKTDLSLGYRYRDYQTTIGSDSTDQFFNIGARGEFTPKLSGSFAVGMNTRKRASGGSDDSDLGLDASFNYSISEKLGLSLGASRDFSTSPQGAQQQNTTVNAQLSVKINSLWGASAGVSYRSIDYPTRTDEYYEGTLGASYAFNSMIRIGGTYTYRQYFSDLSASEFTNNVFALTASIRY